MLSTFIVMSGSWFDIMMAQVTLTRTLTLTLTLTLILTLT